MKAKKTIGRKGDDDCQGHLDDRLDRLGCDRARPLRVDGRGQLLRSTGHHRRVGCVSLSSQQQPGYVWKSDMDSSRVLTELVVHRGFNRTRTMSIVTPERTPRPSQRTTVQ